MITRTLNVIVSIFSVTILPYLVGCIILILFSTPVVYPCFITWLLGVSLLIGIWITAAILRVIWFYIIDEPKN